MIHRYYDDVLLLGLLPRIEGFTSPVFGLCGPLPPERGLGTPLSSLIRGLQETRGLSRLLGAFAGVEVVLVILGLLTCLNSPLLLVKASSSISESPA